MTKKYPGIANELRARIANGEWNEEGILPSEENLCLEYNVARMTLRAALDALVDEGLVEKKHGIGTILVDQQARQWVSRAVDLNAGTRAVSGAHFLADAEEKGYKTAAKQKVRFEKASPEVAAALKIRAKAEVCVREEVSRVRGEPIQLMTSYVARKLTKGTAMEDNDLDIDELYGELESAGNAPLHFHEVVRGRTLNEYEKQRLDNLDGLALVIERTATVDGKPVELNLSVLSMKQCELTYDWENKGRKR